MKKALIFMTILSLVIFNCSKKNITNNYYPSADKGAIVGFVYPPESEAKVIAYLGLEVASTYIDTNGYFELSELSIGNYTLMVEAEGYFDYQSKPNISVTGGATVSVDTVFLTSIHDLILSVSPYDGAEGVRLEERIRIRFRTSMNTESAESAFRVEPEVEGEFSWYDGRIKGVAGSTELHFIPKDQFATNTRYQVTIDTTASDAEGIKLSEPYQFSFTTEPIRMSTRPTDKETQVNTDRFVMLIKFNTDMNSESVISAFKMVNSQLKEVSGEFVWPNQRYMEFHPHSTLASNEEYTVTIDTTAADVRGGRLTEPYQFSFTTEPITIVSTTPKHKDTWVSPYTKISIVFNISMNTESAILAFKMVDSQLKDVSGEFIWLNQRQMEFHPHSTLAANEEYIVTIDTTAANVGGGRLPQPYQFSFTTEPIRIVSTRPKHKESWVSPYTRVSVAFNTDMDPESVILAFKMVDSQLKDVTGTFLWHDSKYMDFQPDSPLTSNETYTVTIDTNAKDISGGSLDKPYNFWFKTAPY